MVCWLYPPLRKLEFSNSNQTKFSSEYLLDQDVVQDKYKTGYHTSILVVSFPKARQFLSNQPHHPHHSPRPRPQVILQTYMMGSFEAKWLYLMSWSNQPALDYRHADRSGLKPLNGMYRCMYMSAPVGHLKSRMHFCQVTHQ